MKLFYSLVIIFFTPIASCTNKNQQSYMVIKQQKDKDLKYVSAVFINKYKIPLDIILLHSKLSPKFYTIPPASNYRTLIPPGRWKLHIKKFNINSEIYTKAGYRYYINLNDKKKSFK